MTAPPFVLVLALAVAAGDPSAVPDDATLEASGTVVGTITIRAGSIFDTEDPKEDTWVFRVANKLHMTTRDRVIQRQLTFAPGERYSRRALDESERHLRHNGYLYDAKIRPVRYDGSAVDIVVETRDVWTLRPGAGFGRSGGVNRYHFGLHDANFLGLGKSVMLEYVSGVDRSGTVIDYLDPALAGTHASVELGYASNSDGSATVFGIERPFWRLRERWGGGLRAETNDRVDPLYALGEVVSRFREQRAYAEAHVGRAVATSERSATRLIWGVTFDRSIFDPLPEPGATITLPGDRTLAYPWIGVHRVSDGYVTARDMDKLGRTEDVNLGRELRARLGWCSTLFGADRNAAVGDVSGTAGFSPGPGQILTLGSGVSGRWATTGPEDVLGRAAVRYYDRNGAQRMFVLALSGTFAVHPDVDHQILLGGDNGLRGYPLRYATGDRALLFTIEQRFFYDREIFHLVRLGAAVYADVGKAHSEAPELASHLGVLKDVGVGLRIGQTRSAHANVVRIDLAMPLDDLTGRLRPQLLVSTGETF